MLSYLKRFWSDPIATKCSISILVICNMKLKDYQIWHVLENIKLTKLFERSYMKTTNQFTNIYETLTLPFQEVNK